MTLSILSELGIKNSFEGEKIKIFPSTINHQSSTINYTVESDWSSASYYYSLAAIGRKTIHLKSFRKNSLQGDSVLAKLYSEFFGISTEFDEENYTISLFPASEFSFPDSIVLNMNHCPDIAQTVCVTATALHIPFEITGLATLNVKETDRRLALQYELLKIGCKTEITDNSIKSVEFFTPGNTVSIKTYNDHRMAMSFAPFCLIQELEIENDEVVEKSYPDFWKDFLNITETV